MKQQRIENLKVDLQNDQFFEIPDFQRRISQQHVRKIKKSYKLNPNLVDLRLTLVKRKKQKSVLLDGQHRWVAMRQLFDENELISPFTFPVSYIEGLKPKERLQVYHNLNAGKSHSTDDMLQGFKDTIWIYNQVVEDEDFPVRVSIYSGKFTFPLRKLLQSYAYSENEGENGGIPDFVRPQNIVNYAQSLKHKDYNFLKHFLMEFKNVFGEYEKMAIAYRSIYFNNLMRYVFRNRHNGGTRTLLERVEKVVVDPHLREMSTRIDRESTSLFYRRLLRKAQGRMKDVVFK